MPYDEIQSAELTEEATDALADAVADRLAGKADWRTPRRTIFEDEGGIRSKPGQKGSAAFYGGDDVYTLTGRDDAERATNLHLAQTMIEVPDPRSGRPERWASDRLREVMVGAAEKALSGPSRSFPAYKDLADSRRLEVDPDGFATKAMAEWRTAARQARAKAMTSTGAGAGDEWVPTFAASELWNDIHFATIVAPAMRRVQMPTNPFDLPSQTASVTWKYASSENTAVTATDPTTAKEVLSAKKLMAEVDYSSETEEDSIVAATPAIRADLVRSGAQAIDDLLVHGDTETGATGNVNSDDAAPVAGDQFLALNGLRKYCLVTNTGQVSNLAGAVSSTNFNTLRALLGKYGARASDLVIITGGSTFVSMNTITEVITPDKYGAGATILAGELARFFGIPILLSEAIPLLTSDKVAADGKADSATPANNTTGWLVLVNRRMWTIGFRRELRLEAWRDIKKDQSVLVASFRQAQIPASVSVLHTAVARNATV
ncbi:MAG: phage major capsid protein [Chloroflexota bacterium]